MGRWSTSFSYWPIFKSWQRELLMLWNTYSFTRPSGPHFAASLWQPAGIVSGKYLMLNVSNTTDLLIYLWLDKTELFVESVVSKHLTRSTTRTRICLVHFQGQISFVARTIVPGDLCHNQIHPSTLKLDVDRLEFSTELQKCQIGNFFHKLMHDRIVERLWKSFYAYFYRLQEIISIFRGDFQRGYVLKVVIR